MAIDLPPYYQRRLMATLLNKDSLRIFLDRRVITMLFLGFSAGLPILLIFGTLSVWLREAGVARSMVTYFSWAALGYSFKFVWAPLIDQLKLPVLGRLLGRRRSWLLVAQCAVICAIWIMSSVDPAIDNAIGGDRGALVVMALGAVLLGFSSATQDIVIDAFRIESAEPKLQAILSSTYIAGYRIAMIVAGAGALYLADYLGSVQANYDYEAWKLTYRLASAAMLVGIVTTLCVSEPAASGSSSLNLRQNVQLIVLFLACSLTFISSYLLSANGSSELRNWLIELFDNKALASTLVESLRLAMGVLLCAIVARLLTGLHVVGKGIVEMSYVAPVRDFFDRYGLVSAWLLLALIGLYRISDIVLGVIANVFYYDLGFTKTEIATVSKFFGLGMTIVGGFVGGWLAFQFGVMPVLLLGAVLSAATNLLFMMLSGIGHEISMLYLVIGADNLSAGIAGTAFVAFLSALTNIRFTAVQYAIFSSLMTLLPKILGGYSGSMVDSIGYANFFIFTALIGVPVILLIIIAARRFDLDKPQLAS